MNWLKYLPIVFTLAHCGPLKDELLPDKDEDNEPEMTANPNPASGQTFEMNLVDTTLRLTPEQMSKQLYSATGYRFAWDDYDILLESFNIPLGGIDFEAAMRRDFTTKVQTILVVRTVAYSFAKMVLWQEYDKDKNERVLFTECDFADLPHVSESARTKWEKQIIKMYWQFYTRPPTPTELELITNAFKDIYDAARHEKVDEWQAGFRAWSGLLYTLLSSAEFWNI